MAKANGTKEQIRRIEPKHHAFVPVGSQPIKRKRYGWEDVDPRMGQFMRIPKDRLFVDERYQRKSHSLVTKIAAEFDWLLFGVLVVVCRPDGVFAIIDGGNRAEAAARRDDVHTLPCLVFNYDDLSREAQAFVGINENQKRVSPYDRHKGGVVAGDEVALKTQEIVQRHGYEVTGHNGDDYTCAAVARLRRMVAKDAELTDRVFGLATKICDGAPVQNAMLMALFWIAQRDTALFEKKHETRLVEIGADGFDALLSKARIMHNQGGAKIYGHAIVAYLNKGRRTNKIDVGLD